MVNFPYQFILPVLGISDPEQIKCLDPLRFDPHIQRLHELNRAGKADEIGALLNYLLSGLKNTESLTEEECVAVMRDLGIFMGILKKMGFEPVQQHPALLPVLCSIANRTAMPPRDTLLHYTLWNPDNERTRSYTGASDELDLIRSVKMSYPDLLLAIIMLDKLYISSFVGEEFKSTCDVIRESISSMIDGIVHAKRNVSPAFFANELRFYYDPIIVDRPEPYMGPGAVEMPMFLFDHILWNCDLEDEQYNGFKESFLPYNFEFVRKTYMYYKGKPSVWSSVIKNLSESPSVETLKAAEAVLDFSYILKGFRKPHKRLADQSYAYKQDFNRATGSGGYSVDILDKIMDLQTSRILVLQEAIKSARKQLTE